MTRCCRKEVGFSLIETLVSLALFGIVLTIAAALFASGSRGVRFVEGDEALRGLRSLQSALTGDLQQAEMGTVAASASGVAFDRVAPSFDLGDQGLPPPSPTPSPYPTAPDLVQVTYAWDAEIRVVTRTATGLPTQSWANVTGFAVTANDTTTVFDYSLATRTSEDGAAAVSGQVRPAVVEMPGAAMAPGGS